MTEDKNTKAIPSPAFPSGPWVVHDAPPGMAGSVLADDKHSGVMMVPLDDSPESFAVRALEYGRLALYRMGLDMKLRERAMLNGINPMWPDAAIDYMATRHMITSGTKMNALPAPPVTANSEASHTATSLKYWNTHESTRDAHFSMLSQAARMLNNTLDQFQYQRLPNDQLFKICQMMQEYFNEIEERKRKREKHSAEDGGADADNLDAESQNSLPIPGDASSSISKHLEEALCQLAFSDKDSLWGTATVRNPTRTRRYNQAITAMRPKPGFYGGFRYPSRVLLPAGDGQGFGTKQRCHGGTMLVDCSGSMHISHEHIERLLGIAPAMTVALYGAIESAAGSSSCGAIVVVVRKGRGVQSIHDNWPFNGANVIDGPALEWLCNEAAPRIWISDGLVTGVGEHQPLKLILDAERIARKGRIKRFPNIEIFLDAYKRRVIGHR